MKAAATLVLAWALGLILATVLYLVVPWDVLLRWARENESLAGWAQAVGAALAIVAAVWIAGWQHSRELRRHEALLAADALKVLRGARMLLGLAEEALQAAHQQTACIGAAKAFYTWRRQPSLFPTIVKLEALSAYPAERIADGRLMAEFVGAAIAGRRFIALVPELSDIADHAVTELPNGSAQEQYYWDRQQAVVRHLHDCVADARKSFDEAIAEREVG